MKKMIATFVMALCVVTGILVPVPAGAAPSYDSPWDINIAKRLMVKAFYGVEYSTQRNICRQFNGSGTVYVVRKLGRITYNHTPDSVSMREAQKGVIKALVQVC